MDEKSKKYFKDMAKVVYIQCELIQHPCEGEDDGVIENLLNEIYLAGAHAQAEADRTAVENYIKQCNNCEEWKLPSANDLFSALSAAEIKDGI